MNEAEKLIEISQKLHAYAAAGALYTKNDFDKERFVEIDKLAAELLEISVEGITKEVASDLFSENDGYQTPKCDTRAVIFNERDEVLLIKDYDGQWALPGGWCDYDQTIISNTIKEVREEAGIKVFPWRLVAVHSHRIHNNPKSFFSVFRYYTLCKYISGEFKANNETTESGYFPVDALPSNLNTHKNTPEQIRLCLKASKADYWEVQID